jgi:hypothetical protein
MPSNNMNLALHKQLVQLRQDYQWNMDKFQQSYVQKDIDIDDEIEEIKRIPTVKLQLDVAREMRVTSV